MRVFILRIIVILTAQFGCLLLTSDANAETNPSSTVYIVRVEGRGHIHLQNPKGKSVFARRARLRTTSYSVLTGPRGYKVNIAIPSGTTAVEIAPDGIFTIQHPNTVSSLRAGSLDAARFENPSKLRRVSNLYFKETLLSGKPDFGTFGQKRFGQISSTQYTDLSGSEEIIPFE